MNDDSGMIKLRNILENINPDDPLWEDLSIDNPSEEDINTINNLTGTVIPFEVDGLKYKLEISISMYNNEKIAEVKFYLLNNPKTPNKSHFKADQQYQIALKKSQVGITGTGTPFRVLSKVLTLLNLYLKKEPIKYISFTADEENRQKLYRRILARIIEKHNIPYKQLDENPLTGDSLNSEEFWIERI